MSAAASSLRRSGIQAQREVVAWTSKFLQGFQRLRGRSLTDASISERQLRIQECDTFDGRLYWRCMMSDDEEIYVTQSRIKELITYRAAAFAVCSNGELLKLDVSANGQQVYVVWKTQLVARPIDLPLTSERPSYASYHHSRYSSPILGNDSPLGSDLNETGASVFSFGSNGTLSPSSATPFDRFSHAFPVHINHAAFNMLTRTFYFTVRTEGIFSARLATIEHGLESPRSPSMPKQRHDLTLIKPIVTRLTHPDLFNFNGLAVDSTKYLLFCCCADGITIWSTYPQQPVLVKEISMPLLSPENSSVTQSDPYRCALRPDPYCTAKALLVVVDKQNSEIVKFNLQYYTPVLPGPAMSAVVVDFQLLAKTGNKLGSVMHPQSVCFDSTGNLFVADNGNQRVQVFTRLETNATKPFVVPLDDTGSSLVGDDAIPVRLSIFEQLKCISPMRTPPFQQSQLILLAGLGNSFGNSSGGRVVSIRCPSSKPLPSIPSSATHPLTSARLDEKAQSADFKRSISTI